MTAARNQAAQKVAEVREEAGRQMRWVKWATWVLLVGGSALAGLTLKYRRDAQRGGISSGRVGTLENRLQNKEGTMAELQLRLDEALEAKAAAEVRADDANTRYVKADKEAQTLLTRLIHYGAGVQGLAEDQVRATLTDFEAKLADPKIQEDELVHARTLHDVAVMRRRLGDDPGALDAFTRAGETFFNWLNGAVDHPGRLAVLRRLAHCEQASYELNLAQGRPVEAIGALNKCTGVYDSLLDELPDDIPLVRRSAELHLVLGQNLRMQNRNDEALETQNRVADALSGLENLDDPQMVLAGRYLRGKSRYETGLAERQKGDPDRAIDAQIDATEILVSLAEENPEVVEYKFALAQCYSELGELVGRHRNFDDAKDAHNEAVRILVEIVQANLKNDPARFYLARNYGELAAIDLDEGDAADAFKKVDGAVKILAEMAKRVPGNRPYTYRLGLYQALLAEILAERKKPSEGIKVGQEAVALLEGLLAGVPESAPVERKEYQRGLAEACERLGFALGAASKKDEAKASYVKAVENWTALAEAHAEDKHIAERLERGKRELKLAEAHAEDKHIAERLERGKRELKQFD